MYLWCLAVSHSNVRIFLKHLIRSGRIKKKKKKKYRVEQGTKSKKKESWET